MSARHLDELLTLWNASLAEHGMEAPFQNHLDLYKTIDATSIGDVPWQSIPLWCAALRPENDVPSWMEDTYHVWFRDPVELVKRLISNPGFKNEFDYAPFHEYDSQGRHRFHDFMSGDWAWKQAVCHILSTTAGNHNSDFVTASIRMKSARILLRITLCLSR
jgi:Plavaka transposase